MNNNIKAELIHSKFKAKLLVVSIVTAIPQVAFASENQLDKSGFKAVLPTMVVEVTSEQDSTKGYIKYDQAEVMRGQYLVKEIPQTIETLNIQKNKLYGTNDLSSIIEGNAGIDAMYDMRGESIKIRGFSADASDVYRDGIRSSGQVRRSTANTERVEILKGPASVLYGRTRGGGVINLVSKKANFIPAKSVGIRAGSWDRIGASIDLNDVVSQNIAVRLTGDYEQGDSFRSGVDYKNKMFSPSVMWVSRDGRVTWESQYTYDEAQRVPDRNPEKEHYDAMGLSYNIGFAHSGDEVKDTLHFLRSSLRYDLSLNWAVKWVAGYRKASQDFNHFYAGEFDPKTQLLSQKYAWQETDNKTVSHSLEFTGNVETGNINHELIVGYDFSKEDRVPIVGIDRTFNNNYAVINPYDKSTWIPTKGRMTDPYFINHHNGKTNSFFIQDLMSLTPRLKIMLGGRVDRYKFESTDKNDNHNSYSGSTFSPNAGVVYNFLDEHNAYLSYSKSFAPYGGNGNLGISASSDPETFNTNPEHNDQYEIGIKSDWLNDRLSTTASIYQISHYDIRYQPDYKNNPYIYAIRGEERSRGVDLSAIGQVANNWYVRGSLGLMDSKIVQDKRNPINEGQRLKNTSNIQGNLFIRYVSSDKWLSELGVTHSGKRYNYNRDGSENHLDGFTRFDAMLGYNHSNSVKGTVGIHNIFDTKYWRSNSMPSQPRSVIARLTYEF